MRSAADIIARTRDAARCSVWLSVGVALALSAAATLARAALEPLLAERAPYIMVLPAVMTATLWCGWVCGLATLVCTLGVAATVFTGRAVAFPSDWTGQVLAGLTFAVSVMVLALAESSRRSRESLRAAAEEARRQAGRAHEAEARYRAMVETSPDAILVHVDDRIVYANEAAARLLKAPGAGALIGRPQLEMVAPELREQVRRRREELRRGGASVPYEPQRWLAADGTPIDGEASASAVAWEGRGAVMVVMRDVGERLRAEAALRESETRFRLLAEAVPDIIYTCLPDGACDYVNGRFSEATGIAGPAALGYGWLVALHPDDAKKAREDWLRAHAASRPYEFRYRLRSPGGEFRWFIGRSRPILDPQGNVVKWFGTITDVHEMVRDQEHLRRQASTLAQSNSDLEDFAATVAHDLKEPLRGIGACAQMLAEDYAHEIGREGRALLETLVRLPQRMTELLDSLLEFSRAEHGGLHLEPVDLEQLARRVAADLGPRFERDGARVRVQSPLPTAVCDPRRLEQVLTNLVTNGLKYNRSEEKVVEVGARDGALFVRDNGIGIDRAHHASIFSMFKRLHTRDSFGGGAGAGLAIVRKLVERHGGRVWVESEPGKGATFWFTLGPVGEGDGARVARGPAAGGRVTGSRPGTGS